MAINRFIGTNAGLNTNEQALIKGLVTESIQFNGIDVTYLPRTVQKDDTLFHDDPISSFETSYDIEAYVENYEGFEGDGDLLGSIGLTINDQVSLQFSQERFAAEVAGMTRPLEGDLIYFPLSKSLFEIKFVEHEDQFYAAGTLPSFKVKCELFDFSGETFNTGISSVDALDDVVVDSAGDSVDAVSQSTANNTDIQSEASNFLDFTETNPFGAP